MYEAVLSDDPLYNLPDNFTSRTSEVLQVYFKSLGVGMDTIIDEEEWIAESEDIQEIRQYEVGNNVIMCTHNEMYYLRKLAKLYKRYLKDNPHDLYDWDEVWDYIVENLPFKKKHLTQEIIDLFKRNHEAFSYIDI